MILADLIANNNDATLDELCQMLQEKIGVKISRATMGRMTQRLKLTVKKKTLHPNEKETERVQKLRVDFWEKIRDVPVKDLIFLDEAGVNARFGEIVCSCTTGSKSKRNSSLKTR